MLEKGERDVEDVPIQVDEKQCLSSGYPGQAGLEIPDDNKLGQLQREDPYLKDLIRALEDPEDEELRKWATENVQGFNEYILNAEGVLCKQVRRHHQPTSNRHANRKAREMGLQVLQEGTTEKSKFAASETIVRVIPAVGNVQAVLMAYFHGSKAHGHPGYKKMLTHMSRVVYWRGMSADVRRFVQACWCMKDGKYNLTTLRAPPAGRG